MAHYILDRPWLIAIMFLSGVFSFVWLTAAPPSNQVPCAKLVERFWKDKSRQPTQWEQAQLDECHEAMKRDRR